MKNTMAKRREIDNPYEVWANDQGWTWKVLKKYQADDYKPHARWLCAVSSPYTRGGYDIGDVYALEVIMYATKLNMVEIEEIKE